MAQTSRPAATTSSAGCPTTTWWARCTTRPGSGREFAEDLPDDKVV